MKVVILSDTHDNIPNLKKALGWINGQGVEVIIHCGDIFGQEILERLAKNFSGKIYVSGDSIDDDYPKKEIKNLFYFSGQGEVEIGGKKIAFTHRPEQAEKLANSGKYDIVFYGHTHKPWETKLKIKNEKLKIVRLINPGNLCGFLYPPTFAIYDTETDKLELKILEKL